MVEELSRQIECATDIQQECELRLRRANILRRDEKNLQAMEDFLFVAERATGIKESCDAKFMLTLMLIEAGEHKEALWWAAAAVDRDGSSPQANTAMGLALDANEFHHAAIPFFRRVLECDPESHIAQLKLGTCLREIKDFDQAHEVLLKLVKQGPDVRALFELGQNWQERDGAPDSKQYAENCYTAAMTVGPSEDWKLRIEHMLRRLNQ